MPEPGNRDNSCDNLTSFEGQEIGTCYITAEYSVCQNNILIQIFDFLRVTEALLSRCCHANKLTQAQLCYTYIAGQGEGEGILQVLILEVVKVDVGQVSVNATKTT